MPKVLAVTSQEIDSSEKRSKYTVSVIGLGQKGILFATSFADAGFKVVCSDANPSVMKKVARGKTPFTKPVTESKLRSLINTGQLMVISEVKQAVSQGDIIILTVPAKIDDKKKVDFSEVLSACKQIGGALRAGSVVIYGEVAAFGFIEGVMKEVLENISGFKVGYDFDLAYMPIHNLDAKLAEPIANLELRVAAVGKTSLDAITNILHTITKNVKQASDVRTAEAAALLTVAKHDANVALANEMAVFCENANLDYFEVLKMESDDKTLLPKAVEENADESYLFLESAENINAKFRLLELSRQINEDMVKHAVNLTQDALRSCGKTLRRSRVAVLGTVSSTSDATVFVKILSLKGAKVSLYDPTSRGESSDLGITKTSLNEAVEGADCIIILTDEEHFRNLNLRKLKPLTKTPSVIVDLAGIYNLKQVETEGFIYRGLGRGTEKQ